MFVLFVETGEVPGVVICGWTFIGPKLFLSTSTTDWTELNVVVTLNLKLNLLAGSGGFIGELKNTELK